MKSPMIFTLCTGSEHFVTLHVGNYRNSANLCVLLVCAGYKEAGEPFTDVTKNIGVAFPPYCAAVKNYSENEGMVDFLIQNRLGELLPERYQFGYAEFPIFRFDRERLMELDPQGVSDYEGRLKKGA